MKTDDARAPYIVSISSGLQEHGIKICLTAEEARVFAVAAARINEDADTDPTAPSVGITPCRTFDPS